MSFPKIVGLSSRPLVRPFRSLSRGDSASSIGGSIMQDEEETYDETDRDNDLPSAILRQGRGNTLRRHSAGLIKASKRMLRRGSEILETFIGRSAESESDGLLCPIKDKAVQTAIVSLFQQKKLSNVEMTLLCENVRGISRSDLGPFIYDYYKNQLMPRGLRILRDKVELLAKDKECLLEGLSEVWDNFYKEILPMLQVVLRPVQVKDMNIRQVTLVGFRDIVLLKTDIEDALDQAGKDVSPPITQMLLVLQSIQDTQPPSDSFLRLERLVARVVDPYLGYLGLYRGRPEPEVRSLHRNTMVKNKSEVSFAGLTAVAPSTPDLGTKPRSNSKSYHMRHISSTTMVEQALEPVLESGPTELTRDAVSLPRHLTLVKQDSRRHSMSEVL